MLTRHPTPAPEWDYISIGRVAGYGSFRVRDIEHAIERIEAPDQRLNATDVRERGVDAGPLLRYPRDA
jgi:hypothetical protein